MNILNYQECIPLSRVYRDRYFENWFRIHSLVDSKRYPEDKGDWDELFLRHGAVVDEIFNEKCMVNLVWIHEQKIGSVTGDRLFCLDEDYNNVWVYSAEAEWSMNWFGEILRKISQDELSSVMVQNVGNGNIYSPYDGGADIFIKNIHQRNVIRKKFSKYLSIRDDGL